MQHYLNLMRLLLPAIVIGIHLTISAEQLSTNEQIKKIDEEINVLQQALKKGDLREINEEVEAQKYFIADWSKYREEFYKVKDLHEQGEKIQSKIKQLEEQKIELLKSDLKNIQDR